MEIIQENIGHEHRDHIDIQSFDHPKEIRNFPKGHLELINMGGVVVGKATLEPGWKWSESIQPIAKTKSCEAAHFQYHLSGVLMVRMDDGTTYQCRPGDVSLLPPGHDAWVDGSEPFVGIEVMSAEQYAKA